MGLSLHFIKVKWTEQVVSGLTPVVFQLGPLGQGGADRIMTAWRALAQFMQPHR